MAPPPCPYLAPPLSTFYPPGPPNPRPHFSYEFFPPLTQPGTLNLHDRIHRMASLGPAAISVTWGAGGSTSDRSLGLAKFVAEEVRGGRKAQDVVECILHLTCTNMERSMVVAALDKAQELGIRNILALRGDPPRDAEYSTGPITSTDQPFVYALDLVKFIKANYGDFFCIGVAGYPDCHPDSPSPEADVAFLKAKVDAGADFIITQLFYDVDVFLKWQSQCREAGITVPIIPGVMPIQNFASFRRMTNLCKASVPQKILDELEPIKNDDNLVKSYGVDLAVSMVNRLVSEGKVEGVHFCTLNLEKSVRKVLDGLHWAKFEDGSSEVYGVLMNGATGAHPSTANALIEDPSNPTTTLAPPSLIVSPTDASLSASVAHAHSHQHLSPAAPSAPKQEGDSWDEFPNGRFTDTRSPAYGELDGYGAGLKILPQEALTTWGTPTSPTSISALFTSYLLHQTPSIPWCPTPLDRESEAILPLLLKLNSPDLGWWTVGSQPAVDGAASEDEVYGFGPRGGYVFQKAFVEVFVKESVVRDLAERAKGEGGNVTFYAGNKKGDWLTNMGPTDVNAVTWAIFPGQEIVQSTIIDDVSFVSWKEEAFSIWQDWSYLYPANSPSRTLLQELGDELWLVSLVHHDYKDPDGLGRFLLGEQ